jgi:hypothetical protein
MDTRPKYKCKNIKFLENRRKTRCPWVWRFPVTYNIKGTIMKEEID